MTPADRNELIDRAIRVAHLGGVEYMIERAALEEHLIAKVNVADLIAIRDGMRRRNIGVHLICDIMNAWHLA